VFSKNGIIEYINNFIMREESAEESKRWDIKVKTSDLVLGLKKEGSEFSKE
jgi:hypothetical protein